MIQKLQTGGTALNTHIAAPQRQATAKAASASDDDGLISKDLLKQLNGIPVDVDNLMESIADLEHQQSIGLPVSARTVRSIQANINRVAQQAKYLEDAENRAVKNDAIGEIAVGDQGQLYTLTKEGDIKGISASEYNIEKHGPAMTVNQLIEHRKFNPTQAYDSSLTQVIGNSIGMSKISDYIQKIVASVGSSETSSEAYTDLAGIVGREQAKRPSQEQLQTLQQLYQLSQTVGMDAIFKEKNIMKQKNVQEAFTYISNILPRNMRLQLQSRMVANGIPVESSADGVAALIGNAIMSGNDVQQSYSMDYESSINKDSGTTKGSSKTFYQRPNEAFFDGDLNQTTITLSDNKNRNAYAMQLKGNMMPALTTDNGNAVANLPLQIALNETIGKYLDKNQIYIGEEKLTEGALNNVAYSNSPVAKVYMPVDQNGNIDWAGFHAFSEAEEEIKRNKITDYRQKNQIHAAHHSYATYDSDGNIQETDYIKPYMMTYGYTIDDLVNDENSLTFELDGDEEQFADQLIESIYNKKVAQSYGLKKMAKKQIWDDIVKVPIFIKVDQFASGDAYRYGGHGSNMTPRTLQEDMVQEQLNTPVPEEQRIMGNSSLLYQE